MLSKRIISPLSNILSSTRSLYHFTTALKAQNLPYANTADYPNIGDSLMSSWISQINDSTKVSNLAIPGTRASGSYFLNGNINILQNQTQSLNIKDQLESGVRFIDLNLNFVQSKTVTPDGLTQDQFDEVFQKLSLFLGRNPS